jgi:hypothetical protein
MARRKRKLRDRSFSEAKKEKLLCYNVGHSWFDNDDNECDVIQSDQLPDDFDQEIAPSSGTKFCPTSTAYNLKEGHRIVDINVLSTALSHFAVCFVCKKGTLSITETPIAGWATEMGLLCSNSDCCRSNVDNVEKFFSSTTDDQGHAYTVNRNMVLALRSIGRGWSAAMKFSAVMGLPKPLCRTAFASQTQFWKNSAEKFVKEPLVTAAKEVYDLHTIPEVTVSESESETSENSIQSETRIDTENGSEHDSNSDSDSDSSEDDVENCDDGVVKSCSISIDGSWLTRGFASKHGFVSVISTETAKVLDMIYLCSTCRGCTKWKNTDQNNQDYLEWFAHHEPTCPLNHQGSAQSMEAAGAVILFQRSERLHNLRYKYFIGDGDSKSYAKVVAAQPYGPNFNILKKECVGHVQKRMGTRLRRLIAKNKGKFS